MKVESIVAVVLVERPVDIVWEIWTNPEHMMQWNIPSHYWQCLNVQTHFILGGSFYFKWERKDGTESCEYKGSFRKLIPLQLIASVFDDGSKSLVEFQQIDSNTIVRNTLEPKTETSLRLQQQACQSILNNFKVYVEEK